MVNLPAALTLTDAAADRIRTVIANATKPVLGVRIGVKMQGCSGLSYTVDYAEERHDNELEVQEKGITLFVEPSAQLFLIGTEIDYQESTMSSGLVFNNPNETGRCGCGESFTVDDMEDKKKEVENLAT